LSEPPAAASAPRSSALRDYALASRSFRLDDRLAVVSGAGRGIGRGCALALADAGADVVAMSRTPAELSAVVTGVEARGRRGFAVTCDVTDPAAVRSTFDSLDRVDVVVAAAGANVPEPFLSVTPERLDALLAVNVKGTFLVAQAAARRMVAGGDGGVIIVLSSQMGRVGAPNRTVYCAAKHAVEGLTRAAAVELAPHGVRVNAVAPTFVQTPMTRPFLADPAFRAEVEAQIPLGRIGQVSDVVGVVVFLASPAAAMITGASVAVDGGWTAR
jgi:NAD(P)-dependent dehydrogenase (short-subunit alcohol dehydrogenase family)